VPNSTYIAIKAHQYRTPQLNSEEDGGSGSSIVKINYHLISTFCVPER